MRLINTNTFALHEFFDSNIPPYAILSHCWGSEEVLFHDLEAGTAPKMKGYSKIKQFCYQATQDGFEYAWVDTCCIDKTSSAELSEAINSMFRWYRDAVVCYAYLEDVTSKEDTNLYHEPDSEFRNSRWFTRGWTLQELLAPMRVIFYDQEWIEMGTKASLRFLIANITGINALFSSQEASVAQKMSWASRRVTTRIEDQAYCLMGLFGVNMPPLYGEGKNAFKRLQLEILNSSDDESIFAWFCERPKKPGFMYEDVAPGLLADSPTWFSMAGDVIKAVFDVERPQISMTTKGIRIEALLYPERDKKEFKVPLNCARNGKIISLRLVSSNRPIYSGIPLSEAVPGLPRKESVLRREWNCFSCANTTHYSERAILHIEQHDADWPDADVDRPPRQFVIKTDRLLGNGLSDFAVLDMCCDLDTCGYDPSENNNCEKSLDDHVRTKPLQSRAQCAARFTVDDMSANMAVYVAFSGQDSDDFILLLWEHEYLQSVNEQMVMAMFIPDQPKSLGELHPILESKLKEKIFETIDIVKDQLAGLDRVSGYLKSGRRASVLLRRGVHSGNAVYFLEIDIEQGGENSHVAQTGMLLLGQTC